MTTCSHRSPGVELSTNLTVSHTGPSNSWCQVRIHHLQTIQSCWMRAVEFPVDWFDFSMDCHIEKHARSWLTVNMTCSQSLITCPHGLVQHYICHTFSSCSWWYYLFGWVNTANFKHCVRRYCYYVYETITRSDAKHVTHSSNYNLVSCYNSRVQDFIAVTGIGKSAVCQIVHTTCRPIVDRLLSRYIQLPTTKKLKEVVDGFSQSLGMQQYAEAIDSSHIPVTPPSLDHTDCYNRKGWHSVFSKELYPIGTCLETSTLAGHDLRVLANSSCSRKQID